MAAAESTLRAICTTTKKKERDAEKVRAETL